MIELLLYILIALAAIFFAVLLSPIRFFFSASGGTDEGFELSGRIMVLSGGIGGGILCRRNIYRFCIFLFSKQVLSFDIKPLVDYISRREKKEKEKPKKPPEDKPPLIARMKSLYRETTIWWRDSKPIVKDLRQTIRIDHFSSDVTIGLGNPALMGKIIGILYAVNKVLPQALAITPSWDFSKRVLSGEINLIVTFRSLFFWRKTIVHVPLLVSLFRGHKKRKQHQNITLAAQEV